VEEQGSDVLTIEERPFDAGEKVRNGKRVRAEAPESLYPAQTYYVAVYGGDERTEAIGTTPLGAAVLCLEKASNPSMAFAVPFWSE